MPTISRIIDDMNLPLHYSVDIRVGDEVRIDSNPEVYNLIYPQGGMAVKFGITRLSEYEGLTASVIRRDVETYIGKRFATYHLAGIPYVFPPWLLHEGGNRQPQWEV